MDVRSSVLQVGAQYAAGLEYQSKSQGNQSALLISKVEVLRSLVGEYDTSGSG